MLDIRDLDEKIEELRRVKDLMRKATEAIEDLVRNHQPQEKIWIAKVWVRTGRKASWDDFQIEFRFKSTHPRGSSGFQVDAMRQLRSLVVDTTKDPFPWEFTEWQGDVNG